MLRAQVDSLCGRLAPRVLFSQRPRLHFCPPAAVCECGGATRVSKTRRKSVATLVIGQFEAMETLRHCPRCGAHDRCDELRSLTPHRGQFGFDVIEWVGRALFVEGRNERAVQAELAARNIPISTSEIGFLGKRFIVYLAVVSRFVSWNPHGNSPVCSVDGLPGMTEQSGKRLESVPSPFS